MKRALIYAVCVLSGLFAFLSAICVVNGNLRALPFAIGCTVICVASAAIHDAEEKGDGK